ncbi:NUDIX hydrolase, partial [Streptomyces sp. SA3_actF]
MTQQNADERPGIAAAIVINEGRVLMVRRRVSEGQLSWQFPAGEIESGETGEEAAVRETR